VKTKTTTSSTGSTSITTPGEAERVRPQITRQAVGMVAKPNHLRGIKTYLTATSNTTTSYTIGTTTGTPSSEAKRVRPQITR